MEKNVGGYERIGRLVVGTGLVLFGRSVQTERGASRGRRLTGLGMTYLGTQLLTTALSQRCPMNASLGRNTHASGRSPPEPVQAAESTLEDRARDLV